MCRCLDGYLDVVPVVVVSDGLQNLPPDAGRPVQDGGGADDGGVQVGVDSQDVGAAPRVQPRHAQAVHRAHHCNHHSIQCRYLRWSRAAVCHDG